MVPFPPNHSLPRPFLTKLSYVSFDFHHHGMEPITTVVCNEVLSSRRGCDLEASCKETKALYTLLIVQTGGGGCIDSLQRVKSSSARSLPFFSVRIQKRCLGICMFLWLRLNDGFNRLRGNDGSTNLTTYHRSWTICSLNPSVLGLFLHVTYLMLHFENPIPWSLATQK